jgi:hypothetical protein
MDIQPIPTVATISIGQYPQKILVRLLAVCFLVIALLYLFTFFRNEFTNNGAGNGNNLIAGILMFRAGDNMFSYKETGRRQALFVLGFSLLPVLINITAAIFITREIHPTFTFTGSSPIPVSRVDFILIHFLWMAVLISPGAFLLHKKTREAFRKSW